ncbi:MAG: AAA family ATPase [Patescibacteria group bacterium]
MYLKSLELNGFKSFAKKANFAFDVPITGIVGPNGSGKSNVAEGFRFVLGEQSMKSMRGKRGEDLIWNGSKSASKMNRAGVKLTFDNIKKIFNIDFDEVTLERVVHRDGVNEYFINGSHVRLKDIMEFLSSANIGVTGHHIISQGEADRILSASIKEKRNMIEDALGLKIYQYKREESQRKLEKTKDNIKQVEGLRKEITPHIKFLEKQVEKVRKAEDLREELFNHYQDYLANEEKYLHLTKEKIKNEKSEPEHELKIVEKKIEEYKIIIEKSEKEEEKRDDLLRIERDLQRLEKEENESRNNLSRTEGELLAEERLLERSVGNAKGNLNISVPISELEELGKNLENVAKTAKNNDTISFIKNIIEEIVFKFNEFIKDKKESGGSDNSITEIKNEIGRLNKKKNELIEILNKSEIAVKKIKEEYQLFRSKYEEENVRGRVAERELFVLMQKRSELNQKLFSFQARSNELLRDESAFKNELQEAQALLGLSALHYKTDDKTSVIKREEQEEKRKKIERMKIRLEEAGAGGGEDVKKEFEEVVSRDKFLEKEINDLEKSAETLDGLILELTEKLENEFKIGIEKINKAFQEFFELMFGGGKASLFTIKPERRRRKSDFDLELEDETAEVVGEELEEGIDVSVSLPNKRIKGLSMLSGGERALTSIALLFAISQVNPPPFIILDETDAALDEANSRKYGDMIEELSKHSQLILITHNRETMGRAGILYGVTMGGDGFSKVLSVRFDEALAVAK